MSNVPAYRVSVAPMMDWTDRHCRYLFRQITRRTLLYTEMVTTEAILRGDRERLLRYHPGEHPVALQLGGSEAGDLAECARIGADYGYDEINLNAGCPSDRVQSGRFGACLMLEPDHVGRCIEAMKRAVDIPVTVKSRIGVDDQDEWEALQRFARAVHDAGSDRHIVHARKALLSGLSPKQNREIPPLRYDLVYRLKAAAPSITVILNGGVQTHEEIAAHLRHVDGVMLGRSAYQDPFLLADADARYYGMAADTPSERSVVLSMIDYIESETGRGTPLRAITRHMLGLFQGRPGARAWRRYLSENAHRNESAADVVLTAMSHIRNDMPAVAE
jgi:tRNA-dihydrouridine synthase A